MNNEYQSGLYGTNLKYFQNMEDFNSYINDATKAKEIPNVAFIENQTDELGPDDIVLTQESNPAVWSILSLSAGIYPKTALTVADCAAFTNEDFYDFHWTYIKNEYSACKQANQLMEEDGCSIFTYYNTYDTIPNFSNATKQDADIWTFNEFKYFTGITELGPGFFGKCYGLSEISIPSSVTRICSGVFSDCIKLRRCTIYNSRDNVDIYITDDPGYIASAERNGVDHVYAVESAFAYAGTDTNVNNTIIQFIEQNSNSYVAYNWVLKNISVITAESNPDVYNILTACNYPHTGPDEGYTADDLAAITNITVSHYENNSLSNNNMSIFSFYGDEQDNYDSSTYNELGTHGYHDTGDDSPNYVQSWTFNEFRYFTGLTSLPENCFSNCTTLREITLPYTITSVGERAFHDCWTLEKLDTQGRISQINWDESAILYMSKEILPLDYEDSHGRPVTYWNIQDDTVSDQISYLQDNISFT